MCWKCNFCQKDVPLQNKYSKSGHLARCEEFKTYKKDVLTKEYLTSMYLNKGDSAYEIALILNIESATAIINLLKLHSIPTRNVSDSKTMPRAKEKTEKTLLEKYGDTNPLGGNSVLRHKMEQKLLESEGITNVFQRPEVIEKIQEKAADTRIKKSMQVNRKDKPDFYNYKQKAYALTRVMYKKYKHLINPQNLTRSKEGYHLDHIVSLAGGFKNGVPLYIIAHPANLRIIPAKDNISKNFKSDMTLDELFKRIETYEQSEDYQDNKT
jgi:hypothetical protein